MFAQIKARARRRWRRVQRSWRQYWCRRSNHQPIVWRWRQYRRSPAYYFITGRSYGYRLQQWRQELVLLQEQNYEDCSFSIRCDRCGIELMRISQRDLLNARGPVDWLARFKAHWQKHSPAGWVWYSNKLR